MLSDIHGEREIIITPLLSSHASNAQRDRKTESGESKITPPLKCMHACMCRLVAEDYKFGTLSSA